MIRAGILYSSMHQMAAVTTQNMTVRPCANTIKSDWIAFGNPSTSQEFEIYESSINLNI